MASKGACYWDLLQRSLVIYFPVSTLDKKERSVAQETPFQLRGVKLPLLSSAVRRSPLNLKSRIPVCKTGGTGGRDEHVG